MDDINKGLFMLKSPEFKRMNQSLDRRNFLTKTSLGLGAIALGSLFGNSVFGKVTGANGHEAPAATLEEEILRAIPHFAPKAKRVVYLFMSGGRGGQGDEVVLPVLCRCRPHQLQDGRRLHLLERLFHPGCSECHRDCGGARGDISLC